jgi:hypothetical protein
MASPPYPAASTLPTSLTCRGYFILVRPHSSPSMVANVVLRWLGHDSQNGSTCAWYISLVLSLKFAEFSAQKTRLSSLKPAQSVYPLRMIQGGNTKMERRVRGCKEGEIFRKRLIHLDAGSIYLVRPSLSGIFLYFLSTPFRHTRPLASPHPLPLTYLSRGFPSLSSLNLSPSEGDISC